MLRVIAVDLGASSVRVATVDLDASPPDVNIVHRFVHGPVLAEHGLRWDWPTIAKEVERGLDAALAQGPVASIGIDAWGVDYGLLDARGRLMSAPHCYRDARTDEWRAVVERIGAERLYRTTGVQLMGINTIFQLAAHDGRELSLARQLLLIPELLVYELTGTQTGERTSVGTTALVDLASGDWSGELLTAIDVDPAIMPAISRATWGAGSWRGVPVHLVGGHDTASAVAALPTPKPNAAFISSGTWMLVGIERAAPDVSDAAMRANFSNEAGVFGNVRFLKNVMGLWMLEQCRAQWGDAPLDALLSAASALPAGGPSLDATDARFLAPTDMAAEVRAAARLPASAGRDAVVRCILDSLAAAAAHVVHRIESLTGNAVPEIVVVGGGSRNALLNRLIEGAAEIPVRAGPPEATLLGNALVQGVALGRFAGLDEARASLDAAGA
jgi:rhamnulokinase